MDSCINKFKKNIPKTVNWGSISIILAIYLAIPKSYFRVVQFNKGSIAIDTV